MKLEQCESATTPGWDLEQGITVARRIEEALIPLGYHCALGGSVLHKGSSDKDLDIFIYPHNAEVVLPEGDILTVIANHIGGLAYGRCNPEYVERDAKEVWWSYAANNYRIDFFFLK